MIRTDQEIYWKESILMILLNQAPQITSCHLCLHVISRASTFPKKKWIYNRLIPEEIKIVDRWINVPIEVKWASYLSEVILTDKMAHFLKTIREGVLVSQTQLAISHRYPSKITIGSRFLIDNYPDYQMTEFLGKKEVDRGKVIPEFLFSPTVVLTNSSNITMTF